MELFCIKEECYSEEFHPHQELVFAKSLKKCARKSGKLKFLEPLVLRRRNEARK